MDKNNHTENNHAKVTKDSNLKESAHVSSGVEAEKASDADQKNWNDFLNSLDNSGDVVTPIDPSYSESPLPPYDPSDPYDKYTKETEANSDELRRNHHPLASF